jgi:SAM-dependent methyltransferase
MDPHDQYRDWKCWDEAGFGQYDRLEAVYFAAELAKAGLVPTGEFSVLEIGFGNGHFAGWARAQGWRYAGTEQDPELVDRARAAGFSANGSGMPLDAMIGAGSLDLVMAFDVLEHLTFDEICALLNEVRRLLKTDGHFVARFPSGDSPFGRVIQHGDMTHRSIIGSGIAEQLARTTGFDVVQIRAPVLPIFGAGLIASLRRVIIRSLRALIRFFLQKIYFDNQPRVVEPNMVLVLRPAGSPRQTATPN